MKIPVHIADRELAGNAAEIARAAFTLHWPRWHRIREREDLVRPAFSGRLDDATVAVDLLHQAGVGPIGELAERYYPGPELHECAAAMVSREALDRAAETLAELCLTIEDGELAEILLELIRIVDMESGRVRPDILRRGEPHLRELARPGWATQGEIAQYACETVERLLAPVLRRECGLQMHGPLGSTGMFVARLGAAEERGDARVIHCTRYAGRSVAAAYTDMKRLHEVMGAMPLDTPPDTVFILEERLAVRAACLALCPRGHLASDLLRNVMCALKTGIGGSPSDVAEALRRWYTEMVTQHELGHLLTDEPLARAYADRPGLASSDVVTHVVIELHASAHAMAWLEETGNDLARWCWVADRLADDSRCSDVVIYAHDDLTIRSLLEDAPHAHLRDFLKDMETVLFESGEEACRAWLKDRAEAARRESLEILARRFPG